jgi:3-oxoacyl-[acyl-carrier protein] reductase
MSAVNVIEQALPILNRSAVTIISSICGSSVVQNAPTEYSVSKAALNHYVKILASKYASKELRINSISPGNVIFQGSTWSEKMNLSEKETMNYIKDNVPLGQFIEPNDVAEMVYFLSSDKNRFITGTDIAIDGGQSI